MERGGANVAYLYDINPGPPGSGPTAIQAGPLNGPNGGIVTNAVLSAPVSANSSNVAGMTPGGIPPQDENYCLRWNDYEKKYAETFR